MSQAAALDSRPLAIELHRLLRDLDPSRWDGVESAARARIADLEARLTSMLNQPSGSSAEPTIAGRLAAIAEVLRESVPRADLPSEQSGDAWARFRKQLSAAYEALGVALRQWSVRVPSLRPTNYTRSIFHVITAVVLMVLAEQVLTAKQVRTWPICFAASFWMLEAARHYSPRARRFLLWVFKAVAHPHERYRVNSSTWFGTALAIITLAFDPMLVVVALAVLGFADPAAALIGRRWGRTKLLNGRSLEGTLTFAVVGALAAFGALSLWHGDLGLGVRLAIAVAAAVPAAAAELVSGRVDDNLSIPLSAAAGGWVATLLLVG